jgi:hypothetical protein
VRRNSHPGGRNNHNAQNNIALEVDIVPEHWNADMNYWNIDWGLHLKNN